MTKFNEPFHPINGVFVKNIRDITGDDSELRESLRLNGWIEELPAFVDENGVTIVGHRRLKLAKELKIEPVIHTLKFGKGDEADAKRLRLALASNLGHKPMTKDDRKRIAEYLYGEKKWTMERIAEALDISHQTVGRDLGNLSTVDKLKHTKTERNPKGAGRPKGSGSKQTKAKPRGENTNTGDAPLLKRAREIVRPLVQGRQSADPNKLAAQYADTGIKHLTFEKAVAVERALRDELPIDASTLSMTAQEKLDVALRQAKKTLEAEIRKELHAEYTTWVQELVAGYREEEKHYNLINGRHKGFMSKADYNLVRACLHPDSRKSVSDERLSRAFDIVIQLERVLVSAQDSAHKPSALPKTVEELLKRKAEYQAQKAAQRAARRNGATVTQR